MEFAKQVPEDDASEGIATSLAQTKGCPTEDKGLPFKNLLERKEIPGTLLS